MGIRRVALFVSKETRYLDRHFALYHCPDLGSEIVLVISDTRVSTALEYAERLEIPTVFFDHGNARIDAWLMETVSFYDVEFIVVEAEYHHQLSHIVEEVVQHWVVLIDPPLVAA